MRLLNTKSRKLSYFDGIDTPSYVILSHTWGEEEVSYQDISEPTTFSSSKDFQKVDRCCQQAVTDGYEYVWIDTCCIDKTSSAELSEAINSMYQWYSNADICYAYLSDVHNRGIESVENQLAHCKWLTRGWTLQELLAPSEVVFYDSNWVEIGTKLSLRNHLSDITGIDAQLFYNNLHYQSGEGGKDYSVACRMSWAAKRSTSRVEDMAYCLMGILGVTMPLLYGEGTKAFQRLQEEIMKNSNDHSLFAWTSQSKEYSGLLARSPSDFSGSRNIERIRDTSINPPISITNRGVQITLPLLTGFSLDYLDEWFLDQQLPFHVFGVPQNLKSEGLDPISGVAILNCQLSEAPGQHLGILLRQHENSQAHSRDYLRPLLLSPKSFSVLRDANVTTLFIESVHFGEDLSNPLPRSRRHQVDIRTLPIGFQICHKFPKNEWSIVGSNMRLCITPWIRYQICPALLFQGTDRNGFAVVFQYRYGVLRIGAISFSEDENIDEIVNRCQKLVEPQNRVCHELNENMTMLASIKKCPGGHVADISIHSGLS